MLLRFFWQALKQRQSIIALPASNFLHLGTTFALMFAIFSTLRSLVFHHLERQHLQNFEFKGNPSHSVGINSRHSSNKSIAYPNHLPPQEKKISQSYLGLSTIFFGDSFFPATVWTNEHVGHKPSGHSKTCEASVAGPAASRGTVGLSKGGWMEDGWRMLLSK